MTAAADNPLSAFAATYNAANPVVIPTSGAGAAGTNVAPEDQAAYDAAVKAKEAALTVTPGSPGSWEYWDAQKKAYAAKYQTDNAAYGPGGSWGVDGTGIVNSGTAPNPGGNGGTPIVNPTPNPGGTTTPAPQSSGFTKMENPAIATQSVTPTAPVNTGVSNAYASALETLQNSHNAGVTPYTPGQGPVVAGPTETLAELQAKTQPVLGQVTPDKTVQGQLENILTSGNPLLEAAKARAMKQAASRGLVNSSMASQAGEEAMVNTAMPIAQQDASTYYNQGIANQDVQNLFIRDKYATSADMLKQYEAYKQSNALFDKDATLKKYLSDSTISSEEKRTVMNNMAALEQSRIQGEVSLSNAQTLQNTAVMEQNSANARQFAANSVSLQTAQLSSDTSLSNAATSAKAQIDSTTIGANASMRNTDVTSAANLAINSSSNATSAANTAANNATSTANTKINSAVSMYNIDTTEKTNFTSQMNQAYTSIWSNPNMDESSKANAWSSFMVLNGIQPTTGAVITPLNTGTGTGTGTTAPIVNSATERGSG